VIGTFWNNERRYSDIIIDDVAVYDDWEGDVGDSVIGVEGKNDESSEEQEDGDEKKGSQLFDELEDAEPLCVSGEVLSDMCTDMKWVILSNHLEVSSGPLFEKNTTEGDGEKGRGVNGLSVGLEPLVFKLESCWDICARREWVVTLGSCCKVG